jgi:Family of unknown function (DUF6112)
MAWIPLVDVRPDPSKLPGGNVIQQLVDGLSGWALSGSLAALLISAIVWALGSNSGNYHAAGRGKTGVLIAGITALLVGAAPALINFFNQLGRQV